MISYLLSEGPKAASGAHTVFEVVPIDLVEQFEQMAAALLACSLAVFVFVPLILELAMQRSVDPDKAIARTRRAGVAFDIVLASIISYGLSLCLGLIVIYTHWWTSYVAEVILLCVGVASMLVGTVGLGILLRSLRRSE
jgi:hypothetical protein